MSTYTIQSGDSLSKIAKKHGMPLNALLALNPQYKADPNAIAVGDKLRITVRAPQPQAPAAPARRPGAGRNQPTGSHFKVLRGQLTFDAEGLENPGGMHHSRVLHVPSSSSGATIGRGYDMKQRSSDEILKDMEAAGVPEEAAKKLSTCHGLQSSKAEEHISKKDLGDLEITPIQQKRLFLLVYGEYEGTVKRICSKADVVQKYGATDWEGMDPTIKDLLVDLTYRGDYTGSTRQKVQRSVTKQDFAKFREVMRNRAYWVDRQGVPTDRFKRRKDYVSA